MVRHEQHRATGRDLLSTHDGDPGTIAGTEYARSLWETAKRDIAVEGSHDPSKPPNPRAKHELECLASDG